MRQHTIIILQSPSFRVNQVAIELNLRVNSSSHSTSLPSVDKMDSVPQQSEDCVEIGGSLVWPAVRENFLLDTMLEEMKKGHLVSATFSKTGWQRIINALKDKFNKLYTQKQLVNKYGVMKTKYSNFKKLLSHKGMGYNEVTGQLTARGGSLGIEFPNLNSQII
ncbi:hypothetical protein LINPERHAP2_LOCUS9658 [Linum perenne]